MQLYYALLKRGIVLLIYNKKYILLEMAENIILLLIIYSLMIILHKAVEKAVMDVTSFELALKA